MTQDELKQAVAKAATDHIAPHLEPKSIVGVGTGSTANFFIDYLAEYKNDFDGAVASSEATAERLVVCESALNESECAANHNHSSAALRVRVV